MESELGSSSACSSVRLSAVFSVCRQRLWSRADSSAGPASSLEADELLFMASLAFPPAVGRRRSWFGSVSEGDAVVQQSEICTPSVGLVSFHT